MSNNSADWEVWRQAREREEERRLIAQGDLYELGERRAKKALQEDSDRHVRAYEVRVKQQALAEFHQRKQAQINAWAEAHLSRADLRRLGERFEAEAPDEAEDFDAAAGRWRRMAEEVAGRRERRARETLLTDEKIRGMDLQEYQEAWDTEKNTPRPGYRYAPLGEPDEDDEDGDEGAGGEGADDGVRAYDPFAISLMAAGVAPGRVDRS